MSAQIMTGQAVPSKVYSDVPYVPAPQELVDAMLDLADIREGDFLMDLGSGDGRIAITAAKRYGIHAAGTEIDPELVRRSNQACRDANLGERVRFITGDLFLADLSAASIVTIYLTPGVNLRLRSKLLREMKPGARVISYRFGMGNWAPTKTVRIGDEQVFLWVIPDHRTALTAPEPHASASGATATEISYAGARGPVSAVVVAPRAQGRHPAVMFMHDYGRTHEQFLGEAFLLASARPAAVCLLVDAPPARPPGWRRSFNPMMEGTDKDIHMQVVIDIRCGIDLLSARPDVDPNRIAYVGQGYGANWGAILSGIDARVRTVVLIGGVPALSEIAASDDPELADLRYAIGEERYRRYVSSLSDVDPIKYIGRQSAAHVLLQYGRFDRSISREMAERLADAVTARSKQVLFYDSGRDVNIPKAVLDRNAVLAKGIGVGLVRIRHDR